VYVEKINRQTSKTPIYYSSINPIFEIAGYLFVRDHDLQDSRLSCGFILA